MGKRPKKAAPMPKVTRRSINHAGVTARARAITVMITRVIKVRDGTRHS